MGNPLSQYRCFGPTVGEGAFCIVKKYQCNETNSIIAGKQLLKKWESNDDYVYRFKREIELTNDLKDHENIVNIIDFHTDVPPYTYWTELANINLFKYIRINNQKLKLDCRLLLFNQILSALKYAHSLSIIHRDLSPNNILIFYEGNSIRVKISDFGLGKDVSSDSKYTHSFAEKYGQPYYTAPEQREKLKNSTKQSDIYSLGRVLRFILTGKDPDNASDKEGVFTELIKEATEVKLNDRLKTIKNFEKKYIKLVHQRSQADPEKAAKNLKTPKVRPVKTFKDELHYRINRIEQQLATPDVIWSLELGTLAAQLGFVIERTCRKVLHDQCLLDPADKLSLRRLVYTLVDHKLLDRADFQKLLGILELRNYGAHGESTPVRGFIALKGLDKEESIRNFLYHYISYTKELVEKLVEQ